MEDDELCFMNHLCQREDCRSPFVFSFSEPLYTITDTLQQSVLRTLRFPEVAAAKSVSVDGPVRVDNVDQHVRIRSEIIIPTQSIIGSLEETPKRPQCPDSYLKPCRDHVRSTRSDDDDSEDEDDDDDEEEEEEDDTGEEDDEDSDEDDEECDDEGYKIELEEECEEEDEKEEAVMRQCCNIKPCRDEPTGKRLPQAPSKYPTEIPPKQKKEQETAQNAVVENTDKTDVCVQTTPDEVAQKPQEETKQERTPEEEKELSDLHQACLYLSKEELEVICTKYKGYDKKFKIKRAKSGQNGVCKFKTNSKEEKDRGGVAEKQQEDASTDEDNEYFCEETVKENVVVNDEEDDECDEEEKKQKEKEATEIKEKDSDDAEDEDYEEEEETDPYYGPERPCKAAPIICEQSNKEKTEDPNKECLMRDYSRYDQQSSEEKDKDIFYKSSPKFSPSANKKKPDVVCDDGNKLRNNQRGLPKGDQCIEMPNNKLAYQDDTLYYDDKRNLELTANQKNLRIGIRETQLCHINVRKQDQLDYFMDKRSEQQKCARPEQKIVELCANEYYTLNNNNNNNCDEGEADGEYFENGDDLVKDWDNEDRCGNARGTSGLLKSCDRVDKVEENRNESCGAATIVGEQTRYQSANINAHNGGTVDNFQPELNYHCHENARNQHKYQAYGHSGDDDDDDVDDRYFSSTVLPSGEDAGIKKSTKVNFPTFPRAEPSYFTSQLAGSISGAFSVDDLAISSLKPLAADVSMTNSNFEQCRRVFESMKQRAFGDDFEDYFESCATTNLEDSPETNEPSADTTTSADQNPLAPLPGKTVYDSIDEECEAKRNGFLKSLFGIIGRAGSKQSRKSGKLLPESGAATGDGCQQAKTKFTEKKFFSFGRYKQKNGHKFGNNLESVVKKSKDNNNISSGKSDKRKFRFGKLANDKKLKKLDTSRVIENFLAIENTAASQFYEIDDDFEIKNNGYIFKCGKLMKRLNTGQATELVNENQCDKEPVAMMERSTIHEGRPCQAINEAGDYDQLNGKGWNRTQNDPADVVHTATDLSGYEQQDVARVEELPCHVEVKTPHELANDVVQRSSQTEVAITTPSVVSLQDPKILGAVLESNDNLDLGGHEGDRKRVSSAPQGNSACVQTIVSDESNVDVLQSSLCGFPLSSAENYNKKQGQPRRKVSSFLVVSKSADSKVQNKNKPQNKNKQLHTVIRRKITEQEAIIISRRGQKCKDGKPSDKSKNDIEMIPLANEGYPSKEKTPFNYRNVHESKSLNRTVSGDAVTAGSLRTIESNTAPDSNNVANPPRKIYSSPQKANEGNVRMKYQEVKNSRRNKSVDCLANAGCEIHSIEARPAKEDSIGRLRASVSSYVVRTSKSSTGAESDTKLEEREPNNSADVSTRRWELAGSGHGAKNSFRQKQFVNRNVQGDRKILRETYNQRKGNPLFSKMIYGENHNVNCGADDDDDDDDDFGDDGMGSYQPQSVSNIIFSDKQNPVQHVRHRIEGPLLGSNNTIVSQDDVGSNAVMDNFILNETAEANMPPNAGNRENTSLETTRRGEDNVTSRMNPEMEIPAQKINSQQPEISAVEESTVSSQLGAHGIGQINVEVTNVDNGEAIINAVNAEPAHFLLNVGDSGTGNIVESLLGERCQQQQLYKGELGMVQDCSGSNWEIEPSAHEDYLIVNSKNENVVYHFQSENRPIWKMGDYEDLDYLTPEGRDENANRGKYTKYDADDDDGRDGAIFDESQLMRCSRLKTSSTEEKGHRPRSEERGVSNGKGYKGPEDYAVGSPTYCDRSAERKHSLDSSTQAASSQRKDPSGVSKPEDNDAKNQTDAAGTYCNTCVGKAWKFADAFLNSAGDGSKDADNLFDGAYASEWKDGRKWKTSTGGPENKREEGKGREFWGENAYPTVANDGDMRIPAADNIGTEEKTDSKLWNNSTNKSANKSDKTSHTAEGTQREAKDNEIRANVLDSKEKNSKDKIKKKGGEQNENVGEEFWSNKLYSPTRNVKKIWASEKRDETKGGELNAVHDPTKKTGDNKKKEIPVRYERRIYTSPDKQTAGATKIKNNNDDTKAVTERKITRQYATPTLQMRQFIHLPEKYTLGTHKNKPSSDPISTVPVKNFTENTETPAAKPEPGKDVPSHKDKPINIYEICKPTVIRARINNTEDKGTPVEAKDKRSNVKETGKEKRKHFNETAKSARVRRKERDTCEAKSVALFQENQKELHKAGNKDTKRSQVNSRTRNTSTSAVVKRVSETKLAQNTQSKERAPCKEKIGDWFSQEKGLISPAVNTRRSTKRKSEENTSWEPDFAYGNKQQLSVMKQGIRESTGSRDREAQARDKVKETGLNKKQLIQSKSKENAGRDKVLFVNPCGDGKRSKKWKMYIISERKGIDGNAKQSTDSQPATHHNVSKSRESQDRVPLGSVNPTSRQMGLKPTDLSGAARAEDESRVGVRASTSTHRVTQYTEATRANRRDKDEHLNVGDRPDMLNAADKKSTKEKEEQLKKHSRTHKIDLGEHLKEYEHKRGATAVKRPMGTNDEFGFGQLVQLTTHSRDNDTDKPKLMIGKSEDKPQKPKIFKIDLEEKMSNKNRRSAKDNNTARKQKATEQTDNQSQLQENRKLSAKEEQDRANKAFFDRYRQRQRSQKSETTVSEEHKNQVENSKSEVLAYPQTADDKQSAFAEEARKLNPSRKEERKKWKEEVRRPRNSSANKITNVMQTGSSNKCVEGSSDMESLNTGLYKGYIGDSGQGEGLRQSEHERFHGPEMAGESCVDGEPLQQDVPPCSDLVRWETDNGKDSGKTPDYLYRQSKENRRRQDALKMPRTDTNQTDRFVPTLIDSSVVNTVARAWMDDTERLGINSLQESKLFSPSVLLHQTSGSLSANCHYMSSPREMNNPPELATQHNPMTLGGDYFDFFPRPTLLPARGYQDFDAGEQDHKARPSSSDSEYAVCKLCPRNYFDKYTNDEQNFPHKAGFSGDTPAGQERQQKKDKNYEYSDRSKPYYQKSDKISSGIEKIVSRSYFAQAEKGSENRKFVSKDDSFINLGHVHILANEVKFGEKQSRQIRSSKTPERPQAAIDNQPVKPQANERKRVDPRSNKKATDNSKDIRKTGSADDVKSVTDTSKVGKTANEHLKTLTHSSKPQADNSQNKSSSENPQGKGHMFSYKVSSKGNRPEVVKADPKEKPTEPDIPAAVPEAVAGKVETVRIEAPQEPVQMGLFARILNTLTRSNNVNQIISQPAKDDGLAKTAAKPDPGAGMPTSNTAESSSVAKEKGSASSKNKTVRTRSPLMTKDAKNLRSDYKQNMNCNASSVRSGRYTMDSFAPSQICTSRESLTCAGTSGKLCINSLKLALEWNAVLLIVIFMLYLGTCSPAILKRCLYCPLSSIWELLYKYGLISMGIGIFLISQVIGRPSAIGKVPPTAIVFSFLGKRFSALWRVLACAAIVLYTYLSGPFLSALGRAVSKVAVYAFSAIIYVVGSTLQFWEGIDTLHKPSSFSGTNIGGRTSFSSGSNQPKGGGDFTF